MPLPPGQHAIDRLPRFGTHLHHRPPAMPPRPVIEVGGAVAKPFTVPLSDLAAMPRREQISDFHCVSGWTARNLRWEGVTFETFFRRIVEPAVRPGSAVTHVAFAGLDGYRSVALLEDALASDVLLAERLGGRPLDGDHGAPVRLVSPQQYGFVSTKHLCRIELLTEAPENSYGSATSLARVGLRLLGFVPHTRARVWHEERGGFLPNRLARPLFRLLIPPIAFLSARGSTKEDDA